MISTTQLRIGNWVSFKGLWFGQISSLGETVVKIKDNEGVFTDECFEPIPITKDLLYKLGADDFPDGEHLELKGRLIAFAECRNEFYDKSTSVPLKSVHQVQNFYFALQEHELIILSIDKSTIQK